EDRNKYIKIIQEETGHLTELIKNLFELAKIDQNEFAIKKEKVIFGELVETVLARIRPALEEKNIKLSFYCPDDLIAIVDSERIQQVVLNILDHVVKLNPSGS